MPIYNYRCKKCDNVFDVLKGINDDNTEFCPLDDCDGEGKKIFLNAPGVIFKGSNFYSSSKIGNSNEEVNLENLEAKELE